MKIPDDITKEQLINDLIKLRQRIDELAKIEEDNSRHLAELNRAKAMYVLASALPRHSVSSIITAAISGPRER